MKPDLLNSALQYLKKGFSIIPRNPTMDEALGKKPFTKWEKFQKQRADERQIREWWQRWPTAMIGAICGPISGFFAVDADTPEAELELEQLFPDDLITPSTKTPHGNHILFADHPGIRNYNQNNGHIKFHVRGEGGFLILPPSVRENGLKYEWLVSPFDAPFAPAPLTLLNKINNCIKGGYGGEVNDHSKTTGLTTSDHKRPQRPQEVFTQGNRNEEIFHHAYALLKGGFKKEEVFQSIEFIAKNCIPPYPLSEARKSVESAWERFCEKKEERERSIADEIED